MPEHADAEGEGEEVMRKTREVMKKDVADAAMIAQLIGGADITDVCFTCVESPEPRRLHDCPDCKHFEHVDECDHGWEWECVADAIGASSQALDLWMDTCNAFFATAGDRARELNYLQREGTIQELQTRAQLYAWVDSIRKGGIDHGDLGLNELEVAVLLREGHLPPGWKLVAKKHQKPPLVAKKRRTHKKDAARRLPMVVVNMTANGPQVQGMST